MMITIVEADFVKKLRKVGWIINKHGLNFSTIRFSEWNIHAGF